MTVIVVTRLNGPRFGVNPDLLQRVDATPDTVLTLVDGTKYIVAESMDEVIAQVTAYRATVLAHAHRLADAGPAAIHPAGIRPATIHPADIHPAAIHPATIHPAAIHPADIHPAAIHPVDIHPADLGHPAGTGREPSRLRAVPAGEGVR